MTLRLPKLCNKMLEYSLVFHVCILTLSLLTYHDLLQLLLAFFIEPIIWEVMNQQDCGLSVWRNQDDTMRSAIDKGRMWVSTKLTQFFQIKKTSLNEFNLAEISIYSDWSLCRRSG